MTDLLIHMVCDRAIPGGTLCVEIGCTWARIIVRMAPPSPPAETPLTSYLGPVFTAARAMLGAVVYLSALPPPRIIVDGPDAPADATELKQAASRTWSELPPPANDTEAREASACIGAALPTQGTQGAPDKPQEAQASATTSAGPGPSQGNNRETAAPARASPRTTGAAARGGRGGGGRPTGSPPPVKGAGPAGPASGGAKQPRPRGGAGRPGGRIKVYTGEGGAPRPLSSLGK